MYGLRQLQGSLALRIHWPVWLRAEFCIARASKREFWSWSQVPRFGQGVCGSRAGRGYRERERLCAFGDRALTNRRQALFLLLFHFCSLSLSLSLSLSVSFAFSLALCPLSLTWSLPEAFNSIPEDSTLDQGLGSRVLQSPHAERDLALNPKP